MTLEAATPSPVLGLYDLPFWQSVRERKLRLQCCESCGAFRYPPGPTCHVCLSEDSNWREVSGNGTIVSNVIFRRQYLDAYPAPHEVIAVRLDEGPMMISNVAGERPGGALIDRRVTLAYETMPDGFVLPRFRIVDTP